MDWVDAAGLGGVLNETRTRLMTLAPIVAPQGFGLFRAGETAKGFVVVLHGRIDVFLTGPNGREILLYAVEPGQSCVQTTLGLLGGEDYSGEAVAASECQIVMIPRAMFLAMMDGDAAFRSMVFLAFAQRMQSMMHVLERVAFTSVDCRLATALLQLAVDDVVQATHAELAARIGSAREVISRRLDHFAKSGWVLPQRGQITILDPRALRRLDAALAGM